MLFLGWFGPRGLASIVFALVVVEESSLAGREEILTFAVTAVLLSVFAHGLTANLAADRYARMMAAPEMAPAEEHAPAPEMPVRLRSGL